MQALCLSPGFFHHLFCVARHRAAKRRRFRRQPAHAAANGYFVGAINRVGTEAPWNIGEFYGTSYFCDPRGQIIAEGSRSNDELVTAELDLEKITEVRRTWQFIRDRRPETYDTIIAD